MSLNHRLLIGLTVISVMAASCKKDKEEDKDTELVKLEQSVEAIFNEMNGIADDVSDNHELREFKLSAQVGITYLSSCADISLKVSNNPGPSNPDSIIVDFGSGCIGQDGKLRAGKLRITANGKYRNAGTVVLIESLGYSVNQHQVSGYRRVTNLGTNNAGQPQVGAEVDGQVDFPNNGGSVLWKANRRFTWLSGYATPFLQKDDEIEITGSASGTGPNGGTWISTINTPLLFKKSCWSIVQGVLTISPTNRPDRVVNFGTGTCDRQVDVTILGRTYTVILN